MVVVSVGSLFPGIFDWSFQAVDFYKNNNIFVGVSIFVVSFVSFVIVSANCI